MKLLFRDLLIGVTNFFRDPGAFDALEEVIPRLFEGKDADETVSVWVPGCATGEEVYSVAMLIREHMDRAEVVPKVQLFATDIDDAALAVARLGRYPTPLLNSVTPARLKRFFVADDVTTRCPRRSATCACSPRTIWSAIHPSRAWTWSPAAIS